MLLVNHNDHYNQSELWGSDHHHRASIGSFPSGGGNRRFLLYKVTADAIRFGRVLSRGCRQPLSVASR